MNSQLSPFAPPLVSSWLTVSGKNPFKNLLMQKIVIELTGLEESSLLLMGGDCIPILWFVPCLSTFMVEYVLFDVIVFLINFLIFFYLFKVGGLF